MVPNQLNLNLYVPHTIHQIYYKIKFELVVPFEDLADFHHQLKNHREQQIIVDHRLLVQVLVNFLLMSNDVLTQNQMLEFVVNYPVIELMRHLVLVIKYQILIHRVVVYVVRGVIVGELLEKKLIFMNESFFFFSNMSIEHDMTCV